MSGGKIDLTRINDVLLIGAEGQMNACDERAFFIVLGRRERERIDNHFFVQ